MKFKEYKELVKPMRKEETKLINKIVKDAGLKDIKEIPTEFNYEFINSDDSYESKTLKYSSDNWTIERMFENDIITAYHFSTPAYSNKTGRPCKLEEWVIVKNGECVSYYWSKRSDHKLSLKTFKYHMINKLGVKTDELITIENKIDNLWKELLRN